MMDMHSEAIWQRGSARRIMKEARRRYQVLKNDSEFENDPSVYTDLASTHYSLIKRYIGSWKAPLAVWHGWRAVAHAKQAIKLGITDFNQIDVVATILRKIPPILGGDVKKAYKLTKNALDYSAPSESGEMWPHTRALLLIGLGECELKMGVHISNVRYRFQDALRLKDQIFSEPNNLMAQRQWVRILFAVGIFYFDRMDRDGSFRVESVELLIQASRLAQQVSWSQYEKINRERAKRGL